MFLHSFVHLEYGFKREKFGCFVYKLRKRILGIWELVWTRFWYLIIIWTRRVMGYRDLPLDSGLDRAGSDWLLLTFKDLIKDWHFIFLGYFLWFCLRLLSCCLTNSSNSEVVSKGMAILEGYSARSRLVSCIILCEGITLRRVPYLCNYNVCDATYMQGNKNICGYYVWKLTGIDFRLLLCLDLIACSLWYTCKSLNHYANLSFHDRDHV